jgi:hypothetical protein
MVETGEPVGVLAGLSDTARGKTAGPRCGEWNQWHRVAFVSAGGEQATAGTPPGSPL